MLSQLFLLIGVLLAAWIVWTGARALHVACGRMEKIYRDQEETRRALMITMSELGQIASSNKAAMEAIPSLVSGLTNVSKEQVGQLTKLDRSIGRLHASLFGGRDGSGGFQPYDERAADRAWEIQEAMREGVPEAEAAERYDMQHRRDKDLYSGFTVR